MIYFFFGEEYTKGKNKVFRSTKPAAGRYRVLENNSAMR
jgi:hypothetical protein